MLHSDMKNIYERYQKNIDEIDQFCGGGKAVKSEDQGDETCCVGCQRCPGNWMIFAVLGVFFIISYVGLWFGGIFYLLKKE